MIPALVGAGITAVLLAPYVLLMLLLWGEAIADLFG
jgi:hypothetical protein